MYYYKAPTETSVDSIILNSILLICIIVNSIALISNIANILHEFRGLVVVGPVLHARELTLLAATFTNHTSSLQ